MSLTELELDRLEAAAQVLHSKHHRMGSGSVCDNCRALARDVAAVLWSDTPGEDAAALGEVIERYRRMSPADRETFVQVSRSMTNRPR